MTEDALREALRELDRSAQLEMRKELGRMIWGEGYMVRPRGGRLPVMVRESASYHDCPHCDLHGKTEEVVSYAPHHKEVRRRCYGCKRDFEVVNETYEEGEQEAMRDILK